MKTTDQKQGTAHSGVILETRRGKACFQDEKGVIASLSCPAGAADSFEKIPHENAWIIHRIWDASVQEMIFQVETEGKPEFWLVPGVNYNGNGWGSGAQYAGYRCDDQPWVYAWHRVSIPACTYAEKDGYVIALFALEEGQCSCSIFEEAGTLCQQIIWPETEAPKSLSKRFWKPAIKKEMSPRTDFKAVLYIAPIREKWDARQQFLDMVWRFFYRDCCMERQPEAIRKLDLAFFKQCYLKKADGLTGFVRGMHWNEEACCFIKHQGDFEAGWCGQNISIACALLKNYLDTGDEDSLRKGTAVLDSWMRYGRLGNGLMHSNLVCDPQNLFSRPNGEIPTVVDACNLGVTAAYLFKAAELAEKCGLTRPEYYETAIEICDLILRIQQPNGELARSWYLDGSVDARHGTVGAFLILPLLDAWKREGKVIYRDAALKAFDFYCGEFEENNVTTAGALDSNCIDKESAAPLLRAALSCYDITGEQRYIDHAVHIALYLTTWQWHHSIPWPKDSELYLQTKYDSYGSTSVSAAHNALDQFALYYVADLLKLGDLTGDDLWRQRARAIWYNSTQLISDGTLCINGHVRPAGGQDESIRHTYWGRPDLRHFVLSEWLVVWCGAYRYWTMETLENWDPIR